MLANAKPISFAATSDPASAKHFYRDVLGLYFVSGDQFALVFDMNGTMLRLQVVPKVKPHGYTTLGWQVSNISKEVKNLVKRGVRFERYEGMDQDNDGIWTSPSGGKIAWFKDPDNNILSLTET